MSQTGETFFTIVGCMDGRVQEPVAKFGREKFQTIFPDTITEAGLVGILSKETIDKAFLSLLRFKIADVSLGKHSSKGVIVFGHEDCAGNPVDEKTHKQNVLKSTEVIRLLTHNSVPVIPVFVKRDGSGNWIVEELFK
ncbi:MAG: hypothetical protein A3F31_04295 [Candidatus Levybacteria bacterium RIFCSPHIGHO2_12_FULL_38_12]|nr:MAG: hypothetical protein A2770_02775 [Candidatus Levybacteria bacterium RIFCSPHIGHO2_01_FULL_38_12]OGH22696.1 MAG: hypothetical protein A3F31_04295 [Candidatus Levybacteria bacterium RIFCSPHIGHO2_12_FULL_38_12]OGH34411.1 MAG: hypothetical protein A3A47_04670 [Candidatus Levybacteria bacterium RIFCSPLOWO2_01_FULL_37_20]OGH44405.1 MAG: hypothetical protein A3J14_03040 [Candidatus Levybacteria bacterium RIFCSPLOWO2_02_FULL_37_18]